MYQPNLYNAPGSLTLKSNHKMEYSRSTLTNNWHIKREAEPKDREVWSGEKPTLHQSTYKIIGKQLPDDKFVDTTESHTKQEEALALKGEHIVKDDRVSMVDSQNQGRVNDALGRNHFQYEYDPSLPRHQKDHNKHYLETTYVTDYKHPNPSIKTVPASEKPVFDNSWAHRRMVSQFSDIDAPKREGINTFHVQHGTYPNQHLKELVRKDNNLFNV